MSLKSVGGKSSPSGMMALLAGFQFFDPAFVAVELSLDAFKPHVDAIESHFDTIKPVIDTIEPGFDAVNLGCEGLHVRFDALHGSRDKPLPEDIE